MKLTHDKYIRQLYIGCSGTTNCLGIFCRKNIKKSTLISLASTLTIYGDIFLCENINATVSIERKGSPVLDFYLSIIESIEKCECYNTTLIHTSQSDTYIDTCSLTDIHNFCIFFENKKFLEEDIILLEGVLYLLINNKNKYKCILLERAIVRVFYTICNIINIKEEYYVYISELFLDIQRIYSELKRDGNFEELDSICNNINIESLNNKSTNNKISINKLANRNSSHNKNVNNSCKNCLFIKEFKIYDFISLVNVLTAKANSADYGCIRTSKIFEELLNILHILFLINEKLMIFDHSIFYLSSKSINIKEEYRNYKCKYKSMVSYPYVLPLELKAELIKLENGDIMKNQLQDTFFRSLFEGEKVPYAFLTVRRDSIYNDTMEYIRNINGNEIRKQLKIIFKGEEGVDSGGMTKEFFQLISEEIINDDRLFEIKNNYLCIKKDNKIFYNEYNSIGKILGIALYNDVVLNIPFPTFLFKKILNKNIRIEDLEEIEPMVYNSLINLLKVENIEDLHLTYEITYEANNKCNTVELIPNGRNISLNKNNINNFITHYVNFLTYESIKEPIEQIKKGFFEIIKHSTILFLQPLELEKIIVGTYFDMSTIKQQAIYNGYEKDTPIIKHFWNIFDSYTTEEKRKLLQFITGHDRIPISNNPFSLIIMKNGCDTDRLPSSQTCFNTFLLPEYSTKRKLKEKLDIAINMTKGFYLL